MSLIIVICGPTASGKTNFAHELAKRYNGEIVGADSKQLYKQLPIITASPSNILKAELPYFLYNFCNLSEEYSATKYAVTASDIIHGIIARNKLPIIVGGSGLYINSLIYGYSAIPKVTQEVYSDSQKLLEKIGVSEFYDKLQTLDPLISSSIGPTDTQRILRAYSVFQETGKSIIYLQEKGEHISHLCGIKIKTIMLNPKRELLYNICDERLKEVFLNGAIEEVAGAYDLIKANNTKSVAKTLGVTEIMSYLDKEISIVQALNLAQAKTRQYAKRQVTWFKHKIKEKLTIDYSRMDELNEVKISEYLFDLDATGL